MSMTRAQLMTMARESADAVNSSRWSDSAVVSILGVVSGREWAGILSANPYYRFAQIAVTTDANGQFDWTDLDTGSGNSTQTHLRVLAVSDGLTVYQQTAFMSVPLGTTTNQYATQYANLWYDAGQQVQILPVTSGLALTVSVNWTPPRIDQLSADSVTVDFPDGHEVILWLEAAAMMLSKGGAENDAAQTMRAMADQERQRLYSDIGRRAARPLFLQMPDSAAAWGGGSWGGF